MTDFYIYHKNDGGPWPYTIVADEPWPNGIVAGSAMSKWGARLWIRLHGRRRKWATPTKRTLVEKRSV